MVPTTSVLDTLEPKAIQSLLSKIAKSKGSLSKITKALRETVSYEQSGALVRELVRAGKWNLANEGLAVFELLATSDGPIDGVDARAWIAMAANNPGVSQWWPAAPGWPAVLDRVVSRGYHRDEDAAWESLTETLASPLRVGLDLSRARLGATLPQARATAAVALFAEALLAGTAMIDNDVELVDRDGVRQRTGTDLEANTHAIVATFADEAQLAAALEAAVARGATCSERTIGPVYARLEPASLGALLRRSNRHQREAWPSLQALDYRPLSFWCAVLDALHPPPAAHVESGAVMDMIFALAARSAARDGAELPPTFDALVTLEWPEHSPPFRHVDVMLDALRSLSAPRAHALIARWIDRPMHMFQPAALLVSVAPTPALIERLCARIDEYAARNSDPRALRALALLGVVGEAGLGAFAAAHARGDRNQKLLYAHIVLATLAAIGRAGGTFDASFDRFIDVHQCEDIENDRTTVELFATDFCAAALRALPVERAEPIVLAAIDRARDDWTIGLTLVPAVRTDAVIARAAAVIRARALELTADDRLLLRMFSQLDRRTTTTLIRAALGDGERAAIRVALQRYVPADVLDAVDGAPPPSVDRTEALAIQARALAAKLPGPMRAHHVLGWLDKRAGAADVSRSGGAAIGVRAEQWPLHDGAPMKHLLTVDLAELPALRERCASGTRAIAVFAPVRGRAAGRSLRRGAVLPLRDADLASAPVSAHHAPNEHAMRLRVSRIDAPEWLAREERDWPIGPELRPVARALVALFERAEGRTLRTARGTTARRLRAADDEAFLFEFDDRLIDVALPEQTAMEVYRDALLVRGPIDDEDDGAR